jgi:GH15 family glucan-1,4-alpha-glucosidase
VVDHAPAAAGGARHRRARGGLVRRAQERLTAEPIEDHALIGDTRTAALISRSGSLNWLCAPRFDSGACFAALLGEPQHGRWLIAPSEPVLQTRRRYREGTLVLETELRTAGGTVRLVDCMPPGESAPNVVRLVEGLEGVVPMQMELVLRLDYGSVIPWVRRSGEQLLAVAGPDAFALRTPVPTRGENMTTVAQFRVARGERVPFALSWYPAHRTPPPPLDPFAEVARAQAWWEQWSEHCVYQGPWREAVLRSLLTLKALTYAPTGGIVAAVTTSLPERLGGQRNWDYRYTWLRDATFTLYALLSSGFREEACAWRDWLLRAVAGSPAQLQIMYGLAGERRIPELVLDWLPGHAGSRPVRIGNAAAGQLQLDVYGEVMDSLYQSRRHGLPPDADAWNVQRVLLEFLESNWQRQDQGIWEVRGPARHFTHSKLMAWLAFDRAVKSVEQGDGSGPLERWRGLRDAIHREICQRAYDPARGAFTQAYGEPALDAALLMMPLLGFLPARDPRIAGTVAAIERELLHCGLVRRYLTTQTDDGLPAGEGVFLLCSFWLADCYALLGRRAQARALFERLLAVRNDVGLLAEEYDPVEGRMLGNFPQAFSHVGLINCAFRLGADRPSLELARERS